jgi:hypothetical protein
VHSLRLICFFSCFSLLLIFALTGCEVAPPPQNTGAEVFLYPKAEVDVSAYGVCHHVRNATKHTIAAFGVTERWPLFDTMTDGKGHVVSEVTPCK